MKKIKFWRAAVSAAAVLICYLLQCTLFSSLTLASVRPNLLIIITSAFGFMGGPMAGMMAGFFSGLLLDIQFGGILGFYALIYLVTGYINGLFQQLYYNEDIRLPLFLIGGSDLVYGMVIYFLMFLLRSEFDFLYYFSHIIIPEFIYTILVTLGVYPLIRFISGWFDAEEKRSAGRFV